MDMSENAEAVEHRGFDNSTDVADVDKQRKKERRMKEKKMKKEKKSQTWVTEGPRDPFEMLDALPEQKQQQIQRALHLFSLGQGPPKNLKDAHEYNFTFWNTQPVPKIGEAVDSHGPVQDTLTVRDQCYSLPESFYWDTLDLTDPKQLEQLCVFLNENYTTDDDNTLRSHNSPQFLQWALCPPGWQPEWHCAVRVKSNKKLVGFISAIPLTVQIYQTEKEMVEVDFLCVHKKLRSKRLAPVLIREITRRVRLRGLFQAIFSTGAVLPTPVSSCSYWHRFLNPRKMMELNFSSLPRNMTLRRALKLNRLPETIKTAGLRLMTHDDLPRVETLLKEYLKHFHLFPIVDLKEVEHWFLPRDGVVDTYVVEGSDGIITDMVSFYTSSSTVLNHPVHRSLKVAYVLYTVSTVTPLPQLMEDVLVMTKSRGFDVFTVLDVMQHKTFLEHLKFIRGHVRTHYYLYNWRCPSISSDKIGMVLK